MKQKLKTNLILVISAALLLSWVAMFVTSTKESNVNYWWGSALAVFSIVFGVFGLITARKWSWLKSGVGQAIFFISLGIIMWGIGQAGWMYYILKYPEQEVVQSKILDVIYFSAIPLWTYGIIKLSKATGAKYAFRSIKVKILTFLMVVLLSVFSYYFLIVIARGGIGSFSERGVWISTFDLIYAIGDALNFILALAIFGLSWKLLGGRFKRPIKVILISFGAMYIADFAFSYLDGKGLYYNGDLSDLLFLVSITIMSLGTCMLDPTYMPQIFTKQNRAGQKDDTLPAPPAVIAETGEQNPTAQVISNNSQEGNDAT